MRTTTVIFVRHTDVHNPDDIMYGRLPRFGLSKQGHEDAETTALALAEEKIVAVYTSPMLRAKQTARAIAGQHAGVPIIESRDLIEIKSHFQGRAWPTFPRHPNFYDPLDGDETVVDVFRRIQRLMFRLLNRYPGERVVCVSHGDPIKIIRMGYLGRPLTMESAREPDPAKGCIIRFIWSDPANPPEITYLEPGTGRYLVGYWERLALTHEVAPGCMKALKLEGADILLANVEGRFHVMDDHCGHMQTLLHEGRLDGTCVTCPLHGAQYDVENGKVLKAAQLLRPLRSRLNGKALKKLPTQPRRTYDVRVEGDQIFARIR